MIRGARTAVWAAALICVGTQADGPPSLETIVAGAETAWHAQDEVALLEARAAVEELVGRTSRPDDGALEEGGPLPAATDARLPAYYLAWIDYRLAMMTSGPAATGQFSRLEQCEEGLKTHLAQDPDFGEGWLLLAACRWEGLTGSDLGLISAVPPALSAQNRGIRLAEDSPRAPLVDAIGLLRRPESLGGNPGNAERALKEGLRRFEGHFQGPDRIAWGLDDTWLRLGDLYRARNDVLRARDAYERVLLLVPESRIARQRLESLQPARAASQR